MSFSLETRQSQGAVILELSGRLTLGESTAQLRDVVQKHLASGDRKFVIDLGKVSYIDSAGLGALISSYTSIRNKKGNANLLKLTARIKDLMQVTKLSTVFDVYEGETAAVAALERAEGAGA